MRGQSSELLLAQNRRRMELNAWATLDAGVSAISAPGVRRRASGWTNVRVASVERHGLVAPGGNWRRSIRPVRVSSV